MRVTEKFNFSKSRFFGTAGQKNMIFQNVDFLAQVQNGSRKSAEIIKPSELPYIARNTAIMNYIRISRKRARASESARNDHFHMNRRNDNQIRQESDRTKKTSFFKIKKF